MPIDIVIETKPYAGNAFFFLSWNIRFNVDICRRCRHANDDALQLCFTLCIDVLNDVRTSTCCSNKVVHFLAFNTMVFFLESALHTHADDTSYMMTNCYRTRKLALNISTSTKKCLLEKK